MNPFSWKQRNRDWPYILTIFLAGVGLMFFVGSLANGFSPQWTVDANMNSKIDPNAQYITLKGTRMVVEPVLPAILTPATWQAIFLTPPQKTATRGPKDPTATSNAQTGTPPVKTATLASSPQVTGTVQVTGTSQITPSKTFWIIFASATPKAKTATPKPKTATPNPAYTQTLTPTITSTSMPTLTATKTVTSTRTLTSTITMTPTRTNTPTVTPTWTNSLTPTITPTRTITLSPTFTVTRTITLVPTLTFTPTVTATWTNSMTPTVTLTLTETFTPTITLTPTETLTPSITPTPTIDPINWGPGDGTSITLPDGSIQTFTLIPPISDHGDSSNDFVYYEKKTGPTSIQLDLVHLEVSQDGTTWYTAFNWGNNIADTNSDVDYVARGYGSEGDNQNVSGGLTNGYGIGIDVSALPAGSYPYLRISCTAGGTADGCDIDAFEIYP